MIKRVAAVCLVVSAFSQLAVAQVSQAELAETIRKIDNVKSMLRTSGMPGDCTTPTSVACSFESYCGVLAQNAQELHLYKDADGKTIPNLNYLNNLGMLENCVERPSNSPIVNDPFLFPELLMPGAEEIAPAEQQKLIAQYNTEVQRAEKLFADSKTNIIQVLQSRRTTNNAEQIDRMIQRIRSVKFKPISAPMSWEDLAYGGCEAPNAYYDSNDNSVTLCPQILNYPDGGLFGVIAHELGHAIDSCNMVYDLGGEGVVPLDKNPLNSALTCLQSNSSLGVKIPSQAEIEAIIRAERDAYLLEVREMGSSDGGEVFTDATEAHYDDQLAELAKHYNTHKHCRNVTGSGHMQEAFSDWVSGKAVANKLMTIQESGKAREFAFSSQAIFQAMDCDNINQVTMDRMKFLAGNTCPALDDYTRYMEEAPAGDVFSSHPKAGNRVNRVLLAEPETRKALGCQSDGSHGSPCQ